MTVKRFTIWELNKSQIEDNVELESYICLNEREAEEVCELLNELHEERGIAIDGIKIADELINKYGSDELKHKWKKEVTIKI